MDDNLSVIQPSSVDGAFGYVYVIGMLQARFPSPDVEKEFNQIVAGMNTSGKTDADLIYEVLSKAENAYLAREMSWVMVINNMDAFQVEPRSPLELGDMVEAVKPVSGDVVYHVVTGTQEPLAGGVLKWIVCNRIFNFKAKEFAANVPKPQGAGADFEQSVLDLFDKLQQFTSSPGETVAERAINYVALQYPDIYALAWQLMNPTSGGNPQSFSELDTAKPAMTDGRDLVDLVFSFTDRKTGVVDRYFTTVDVTGQFPFLVNKLQSYLG
jgi:hypothetical protein